MIQDTIKRIERFSKLVGAIAEERETKDALIAELEKEIREIRQSAHAEALAEVRRAVEKCPFCSELARDSVIGHLYGAEIFLSQRLVCGALKGKPCQQFQPLTGGSSR